MRKEYIHTVAEGDGAEVALMIKEANGDVAQLRELYRRRFNYYPSLLTQEEVNAHARVNEGFKSIRFRK